MIKLLKLRLIAINGLLVVNDFFHVGKENTEHATG